MSKLELLLEQTKFLLEKQKEAKKECSDIFSDFLASIDQKAKTCKNSDDVRSLEKIHSLIGEQAKQFDTETQEDIDFLVEQEKALEQVKKMTDKEKAKEVLNMIVDENEEILSTEDFKRNVLEEGDLSKKNLLGMIEDIREAINEGSIKEVELLMESFAFDQDDLDEDDDCCGCDDCGDCDGCDECDEDDEDEENEYEEDEDDEDEDEEEESSCCSGARKCSCGDRCGKKAEAVDILAEFNKLSERLEGKDKKKN